jgi:hypothetical protein
MPAVKALEQMIAQMSPRRDGCDYVFATCEAVPPELDPLLTLREDEGVTVVVSAEQAAHHGLECSEPMTRITLLVNSALDGVGLTAAFSTALTEVSISCNVVAGYFHDHIFVPAHQADDAMRALRELASSTG